MDLITTSSEHQLPVALEDLAQFVLIGREQLTAVRAGIRALDKLDVAEGVRKQKKEEAQMLAEALLDAEVRIGEILAGMPKATRPAKWDSKDIENLTDEDFYKKSKLKAAEELGFNRMQVERFQTLAANKDLVEAIKQEAREADDLPTRTAVLQAVKMRERKTDIEKQRQDIEEGTIIQIDGKYSVISVDPPWPYGREYNPTSSRVANPYPEMSLEEIANIQLPVEDNAVILLWTTQQFLPDAFTILEEWGATYKATIVWNKQRLGMGVWLRMQCEFCLVGIIGKPFWHNTSWPDIIEEPRREHSRKPEIFFEMINSITAGNRLEYFSRTERNGWASYGNDTKKFPNEI